jgi:hypothetical protein
MRPGDIVSRRIVYVYGNVIEQDLVEMRTSYAHSGPGCKAPSRPTSKVHPAARAGQDRTPEIVHNLRRSRPVKPRPVSRA